MQYDILLTKQPNKGYIARPILMPEIAVAGEDETEALDRVCEAIAHLHAQSRIVRIDVPIPDEPSIDPWFRFAGMWGEEANWQQFEADVETFRRTIDEQTQNRDDV